MPFGAQALNQQSISPMVRRAMEPSPFQRGVAWGSRSTWAATKTAAINYGALVQSPAVGALTRAGRIPGKLAMSRVGITGAVIGVSTAMTYDPTQGSVAEALGREAVALGTGELAFEAVSRGGGLAARAFGLGGTLATGGLMAAGLAAFTVGEDLARNWIEKAGEAYQRAQGPTPIKQNQQTMASMRRAMGLLKQGRQQHSMLGAEAQYMHN